MVSLNEPQPAVDVKAIQIPRIYWTKKDIQNWMRENGFGNKSYNVNLWGTTKDDDGKEIAKVVIKFPNSKSLPPDIQKVN